ncbi:tandem-type lipoprotein [Enterococcus sp. BWR-S5]|uniref:tandem-type lipoprotein n=1 Tax=Enterococcus sp. BWR-S5 TaxID=2787714 RepID=UPI0019245327|nr:tandem-type lipoprotein [Enterococcus sp. BWR-S5]MBL1224127.1 tandem-type lipoprotein [Enterococcus sp. BWR-S5]
MKGVIILGIIATSLLSGCETKSKAEVEQSFDKVLAMYPTKNLMDFYDMEGYRDSEFAEDDKGTWILQSRMSVEKEEDDTLFSEGMVLKMNRNKQTAEGYYYEKETNLPDRKETRYLVTYDESGFHVTDSSVTSDIKEKIEKFQFFVQYGEFGELDKYENLREMYNPEVPLYELEYQLTNDNSNVQQLRKRYDISSDKVPTLLLKGRGALDGSSVGYKSMEIRFSKDPAIVFADSISYQPSKKETDN